MHSPLLRGLIPLLRTFFTEGFFLPRVEKHYSYCDLSKFLLWTYTYMSDCMTMLILRP